MNKVLGCCAVLLLVTSGFTLALADPIVIDPPPGAPIDGHNHIISVQETGDGSELAESMRYTLMGGGSAIDATQNPDGSFHMTISLQPGLVRCCPADDPGSDAFFIVARDGGIDVNFSSDFDPSGPNPAEDDSVTVVNVATNRMTEFRIHSPAEPIPEPTSLLLLATGIVGLCVAGASRRQRRSSLGHLV